MTIQPSDDCYDKDMVKDVRNAFNDATIQAFGYTRGYVSKYDTLEVAEYNPTTNPPFFTIRFPKKVFLDPLAHMKHTGPYKSHEYVGDKLKYKTSDKRGFLVGIHGENISTIFNHPFKGQDVDRSILERFGIKEPLKIKIHLGKRLIRKLPHRVQRKLRYWFGEKFLSRLYSLGNR
jgi:hypothetical protein